jgi:hypothetical protein
MRKGRDPTGFGSTTLQSGLDQDPTHCSKERQTYESEREECPIFCCRIKVNMRRRAGPARMNAMKCHFHQNAQQFFFLQMSET